MGKRRTALSAAIVVAFGASLLSAGAPDQQKLPGRQVKVAAIAIGCGGDHESKLKLALDHLETAGIRGVDIACLPEEFSGMAGESIPGPTTEAVGQLARKYHMYVICPIREQAADGGSTTRPCSWIARGRSWGRIARSSSIGART